MLVFVPKMLALVLERFVVDLVVRWLCDFLTAFGREVGILMGPPPVFGVTYVVSHCRIASCTLPMIENDGVDDVPKINGISLCKEETSVRVLQAQVQTRMDACGCGDVLSQVGITQELHVVPRKEFGLSHPISFLYCGRPRRTHRFLSSRGSPNSSGS